MRLLTTLSCLIIVSHFLSGQSWLYWSNLDNSSIRRGSINGGTSEAIFYDADYVFSMKVDLADQLIIWSGLEYLQLRNFTNTSQTDIETNLSGLAATDIELDTARNKLYYLDGSERRVVFENIVAMQDMAIDPLANKIYWITRTEEQEYIRSGNLLTGGEIETLYTGASDLEFGRSIMIVPEELPTGLNESPEVEISVYPNPSNTYIKIQGPEVIQHVAIVNTLGQKTTGKADYSNERTIEVNDIPPGLYYLHITLSSGQVVVEEIMIH
ncbi:MAG: T9SS type A sorting domain-containing protein [Bacteroidota bacterium]